MGKPFYHEKTPVSLNAVLLTDKYFGKHPKIIPAVVKVLNQILKWNAKDIATKGGQSEITWRFFYDRLGAEYTQIIASLNSLGLLQVARGGRGQKGLPCFGYQLTDKCHVLLADANREYLHKILTDRSTKRAVQKRISGRGYWKKVYGDVRDEIKSTVDGITFNEETINSLCECYTTEKAAGVHLVLSEIVEKNYGDLRHNEQDNRIPNPYTQLPVEVKTLIKVHGLHYITTYDIRSAYPSLWARWTQSLHPHNAEIQAEVAAYEKILLNPERSPKDFLAATLGIPVEKMKDVMLQYFNGKGFRRSRNDPFFKFDSWLKSNFPQLYGLWKRTDIKQTGNQIGKHFETKLMLDRSIFEKARSLGLAIGYENDGFSVYGNVAKDHSSVAAFLDYVSEQSLRLLGIKLVIVQKHPPKWNPFSVLQESYGQRGLTIWENWDAYRRRFFRQPPEKRNWTEYEAKKVECIKGLQKCAKVLERLEPEYGCTAGTPRLTV